MKLHGKNSQNTKPTAPQGPFTQAVIPLLNRDPVTFLKAFVLSVKVEFNSASNASGGTVSLLSSEERTRNHRCLSQVVKVKRSASTPGNVSGKHSGQRRSASLTRQRRGSGGHAKSKSPLPRGSSSKRGNSSKKHKRDNKNDDLSHHTVNGPANHITSLLITHIMSAWIPSSGESVQPPEAFEKDNSFLWTGSLIEVLSDLVLAIPTCATAVHKFRLKKPIPSVFSHALTECPAPPKTFLSFVLHIILPQDRWSIRNDQQIWQPLAESDGGGETDAINAKKKRAFRLNKVSQAAARLLVALVARPTEGRKRVVAELSFALSGGRLGHSSPQYQVKSNAAVSGKNSSRELLALQAWGELCLGLAAPRSTGKNPEGNSSLSFEVIKLMLEYGMAHSLLLAIHYVKLHHPMASYTCGSLLLPFEILTRGSVADAVKASVESEATKGKKEKKNDFTLLDKAQEIAAEEEEAFSVGSHEDNSNGMEAEEMSNSAAESHDESEDEDSEDDMSEGEGGEDEDDVDDDDDDEDDNDDESSESMDDEDDEMINDWDDMNMNQEPEFEDAGEEPENQGWTAIESSGFGGLIPGGRRNGISNRSFQDAAQVSQAKIHYCCGI